MRLKYPLAIKRLNKDLTPRQQDTTETRKESLIEDIEQRLKQKTHTQELFRIKGSVE